MTTVARGRCTSAPTPVFRAMGTNPRAATRVVIRTGRNRISALLSIASSRERPSLSKRCMVDTITNPASMATPETATNPIPADTV